MKRGLAVVLTVVMLLSTVGMTGTAAGAQEGPSWEAEDCSEAPTLQPGTYSTTVSSSSDEGPRFIPAGLSVGDELYIQVEELPSDTSVVFKAGNEWVDGPYNDPEFASEEYSNWNDLESARFDEPGSKSRVLLNDKEPCVIITTPTGDLDSGSGGVAFSFEVNDPAPKIVTESEAEELQDEIDSLRAENSELQDEIDSLQSQLENAEATIDVSVEPEDQATFQVGGSMSVDVNAQGASPSDVTLNFAGQEYTASGGEATIPLDSAGTQQLNINYQDATETVTLDVAEQGDDSTTDGDSSTGGGADDSSGDTTEEEGSSDSDETSGGSADDSGPGFGIGSAVAAFGGIGYLVKRRFTNHKQ